MCIEDSASLYPDSLSVEARQDVVRRFCFTPVLITDAAATILHLMGKKDTPSETFADQSVVTRLAREGFIEKLYGRW